MTSLEHTDPKTGGLSSERLDTAQERLKEMVLVRHLMTHTSGLPDQLANNVALRTRHAPLADFGGRDIGHTP
ncbi:MAG: hypothetical protein U9R48_03625 [Chloroflexota bacterium]|nr:hypothetical protein [Chloroflexota bacterium]